MARIRDDSTPADVEPHVVNEDGWAAIPEPLLYDSSISATAVRVYGVLRRHGDDPRNCYPSHARIARLIGTSARSVPAWIRELEDAGWIERIRRTTAAGDPDTNGYRVRGRGVRAGERRPSTSTDAEGSTPPRAPKESQVEREQENETRGLFAVDDPQAVEQPGDISTIGDAWDEFWQVYPRRGGRRAAHEAFYKAIVRAKSVRAVVDGARRFASDPNLPPREFVPHPATWLNQDRWEDDPLPPRTPEKVQRPVTASRDGEASGRSGADLLREQYEKEAAT